MRSSAGPLWTAPLYDPQFVGKMLEEVEKIVPDSETKKRSSSGYGFKYDPETGCLTERKERQEVDEVGEANSDSENELKPDSKSRDQRIHLSSPKETRSLLQSILVESALSGDPRTFYINKLFKGSDSHTPSKKSV